MDHIHPASHHVAAKDQSPVTIFHSQGFAWEPALSDLLHDPIAEALMIADHVGHVDLDALLETARCHLRRLSPR